MVTNCSSFNFKYQQIPPHHTVTNKHNSYKWFYLLNGSYANLIPRPSHVFNISCENNVDKHVKAWAWGYHNYSVAGTGAVSPRFRIGMYVWKINLLSELYCLIADHRINDSAMLEEIVRYYNGIVTWHGHSVT